MATKREKCSSSALFELDENSSIPIWLQLKNRFIYLITSGYYLPGDQLPTVRGLAADVEVNYNTVSKVYMSLEQDGYIQSKRRQGAFVCDVSDKPGVNIASTAEIVTVEYLLSLIHIFPRFPVPSASVVATCCSKSRVLVRKSTTSTKGGAK